MKGRHSTYQAKLRRKFPHEVTILVPPLGLTEISEMNTWCIRAYSQDGFMTFSDSETGPEPKNWSVFAFASEEDAEAFRERWGGEAE